MRTGPGLSLLFGVFFFLGDGLCLATQASKPRCFDYLREWGVRILESDDPAFSDPDYVAAVIKASVPATVPYLSLLPNEHTGLHGRFHRYFCPGTDCNQNLEVLRFVQSGTEANNMLYELAEFAFEKRTGKKATRANLLYFGIPYGGTFGRSAEISYRYQVSGNVEHLFKIPTPRLTYFGALRGEDMERIPELEDQALQFIRTQVANEELQIGGIFIEPISAFTAVYVYRPEFMRRLRELADELGVPIFADEILTGGGRTGSFWAFHHYGLENFEPDVITFGKGLVVSGVAQVGRTVVVGGRTVMRWTWPSWNSFDFGKEQVYPQVLLDNTSRAHPLVLTQSIQVMKAIRDRNLAGNAAVVGDYMVQKLKDYAHSQSLSDEEIRGFGLLVFAGGKIGERLDKRVKGYKGRYTPPLTLTTAEVDEVFQIP